MNATPTMDKAPNRPRAERWHRGQRIALGIPILGEHPRLADQSATRIGHRDRSIEGVGPLGPDVGI